MLKAVLKYCKLLLKFQRAMQLGLPNVAKPFSLGYLGKETVRLRSNHIEQILNGELANKIRSHQITNSSVIIPVPTCVLGIDPASLSDATPIYGSLTMDNVTCSALITTGEISIFWEGTPGEKFASDNFRPAGSGLARPAEIRLKFLIECANKFSQDIFFVELPPPVGFQRSAIGYYHHSKLKFICLNLGKIQLFDTVDQLLLEIFGSKEKLREILSRKHHVNTPEPCEKCIIRKEQFSRYLASKIPMAESYETNISLLVAYIAKEAGITRYQKKILRHRITAETSSGRNNLKTSSSDDVYVYRSEVIDVIYDVLTTSQVQTIFQD